VKEDKLKKGGLDTIVAYIVVMIPLLYVLIYMVATIYHFSVQMYMNQVVKEAAVMASTYGAVTSGHESYIHSKLKGVLPSEEDENKADITIGYYVKKFGKDPEHEGIVGRPNSTAYSLSSSEVKGIEKADILGIYVKSNKQSILGSVTSFNAFNTDATQEREEDYIYSIDNGLYYTSYREEIIRNERKTE